MRAVTLLAVLAVVVGACSSGSAGSMPTGDHVHSIAVTTGGELLLGLHGGLYRSADGVTWDRAESWEGSHPVIHMTFGYVEESDACD